MDPISKSHVYAYIKQLPPRCWLPVMIEPSRYENRTINSDFLFLYTAFPTFSMTKSFCGHGGDPPEDIILRMNHRPTPPPPTTTHPSQSRYHDGQPRTRYHFKSSLLSPKSHCREKGTYTLKSTQPTDPTPQISLPLFRYPPLTIKL